MTARRFDALAPLALGALGAAFAACGGESTAPAAAAPAGSAGGLFVDVSARAGLDAHPHFAGFTPERYLPETMGGGVGWIDYDVDGRPDIYLVESAPLPGSPTPPQEPRNVLLRNEGGGTFADRSRAAGVDDPGFGMGCASGDLDNDGDPELYVLNYGANVLYRNEGDGGFVDVTAEAGARDPRWSVSAGFFDADRDGDLDLYVVNYVEFSQDIQRAVLSGRTRLGDGYPHPDRFDAAADGFLRNDGRGRFEEAGKAFGFAGVIPGKGLGIAFADVDLDGDTDVYVANDSTPNFLFENVELGRFVEVGGLAGCSYNQDGQSEGSMGVDFGDADGDGRPELFSTHYDLETNTYYRNDSAPGTIAFSDQTMRSGLAWPSVKITGFGTAFLDVDNDADQDLLVVNGHIHDNAAQFNADRHYPQRDMLFLGDGSGHFEQAAGAQAGPYFDQRRVGRGLALADFDGDGDSDVLIGNSGEAPVLLENRGGAGRHWIRVRLEGGAGSPRDGQGARIVVRAGGRAQSAELWCAFSYASTNEPSVHFGLGGATAVEEVDVHWPSGQLEHFGALAVDRLHVLRQGAGRTEER